MADCICAWPVLPLISLALLISVTMNIMLCFMRRRDNRHRTDTEELLYPQPYRGESPSRFEEEHQQQENPIYGNINTDRGESEGNFEDVCYEPMTKRCSREDRKRTEPDLNYASLDLNVAQKRKKKRRQQQSQNKLQACQSQPLSLPLPLAQMGVFLEVEAEVEASLPSRGSSPLVSCNSIYLNSQQLALETEDRVREWEREREWQRERGRETNIAKEDERGWDGDSEWERGRDGGWEGEDMNVKCRDNDGNIEKEVVTDLEAIHEGSDDFICRLSQEQVHIPANI